jgi:hypothetical protein
MFEIGAVAKSISFWTTKFPILIHHTFVKELTLPPRQKIIVAFALPQPNMVRLSSLLVVTHGNY